MTPPRPSPYTCKKRNLPLLKTASESPFSTPTLSQLTASQAVSAVSSSTFRATAPADPNAAVWQSIHTLLVAQKDALQAQTTRLAEVSACITRELDEIQSSQSRTVHEQAARAAEVQAGLDELKEMVMRKKEEGYRLPHSVGIGKVLSMGWMTEVVQIPSAEGLQVNPGLSGSRSASASGGSTSTGGDTRIETPQLRLDELIDMSQFETHHDGTIPIITTDGGQEWSESVQASVLLLPDQKEEHTVSLDNNNHTDIVNDAHPEVETIVASQLASETQQRRPNRYYQSSRPKYIPSAATHQPEASSSTAPRPGRPRRDSNERRLYSRDESPLPGRHSRAGTELTDILAGINTYLVRPDRQRLIPDSESPEPIPPPPPPESRLRRRTKHPIYSTKWHPMDGPRRRLRQEEEAEAAAGAANEEVRSVRGLSTAEITILPRSDGLEKVDGKKWRKWGENTLIGRMQVISCDLCRGRVHWACASLYEEDDMSDEAWLCPDCDYILGQTSDGSPQPVPPAQQERCIRPDCIVRSKRPLTKKAGDDARHYAERIIGVISRRVNGSKRYEYLTKWESWDVYESTWQRPTSFDAGVRRLEEAFLAQCKKEGLNSQAKVVLLQEAEDFWDENGDLKRELLEELGIPEAEWWPDAKEPYKVKVA